MAREMTTKAQEAVASALQSASAAGNPQVEPIHLLQALIEQREGIALSLLEAVGADARAIGARTRNALVALPSTQGASAGSAQASRALLASSTDSTLPVSSRRNLSSERAGASSSTIRTLSMQSANFLPPAAVTECLRIPK